MTRRFRGLLLLGLMMASAGRPLAAAQCSAEPDPQVAVATSATQHAAMTSILSSLAVAPEMIGPPAAMSGPRVPPICGDLLPDIGSGLPDAPSDAQYFDQSTNLPPVVAALIEMSQPGMSRFTGSQEFVLADSPTDQAGVPILGGGDAAGTLLGKFLLLLPAIGGVFIVLDLRGHRRTTRPKATLWKPDVSDLCGVPAAAPAPLAALGLGADCSEEDVKQAYRRRAKNAHPDHGGDSKQFLELQRNFEQALGFVQAAIARAAYRSRPKYRQAA